MNNIEISSFRYELEKNSGIIGRVGKFLFPGKTKIRDRVVNASKGIGNTALISGSIAAGGLAYGSVKRPGSII